ncbi:uncharacterized protein LOC124113720 [Haliotis rufescens]|uniref:uncharacterized protein LOC124113720 n=1 Tax=Haliotis rufescens TaxID=6454 RepID=UPI00201EDAEF|nr:uncharacterized protein LOC124113720 [Haliotis rufescens]
MTRHALGLLVALTIVSTCCAKTKPPIRIIEKEPPLQNMTQQQKEALVEKLALGTLVEEDIKQLAMIRENLTDDQQSQLAENTLKNVTDEIKQLILGKLKKNQQLSPFERHIIWALDERNEITSQDLGKTREEIEEAARDALRDLNEDAQQALKTRLGRPGENLTDDDIAKLEALKIEGKLSQDQRDKLDERIAMDLDASEQEELKTALDGGVLGDDELKKLKAMFKAGNLTAEEREKMKTIAGLTSTGESVSDISRGLADIPDDFGLDERGKEEFLEAGQQLKDVIDFDELSDPAALTKFLEEYKKLPKEQKDLLANISTLITSMSKAEIRDMPDAMLEKMTPDTLANLKRNMTNEQRAELCSKGLKGSQRLYEKLDGPLNCDSVKGEAAQDMEEFEKKRMNQNILRKKGNPSRLSGDDVDDFLSTGLVDKDILKLIDPADFLSNENLRETAIRSGESKVLKDKFKEAKGSLGTATAADLKKMTGAEWTLSDAEDFPEDAIRGAAKEFLEGVDETDMSIRAKVGEIVKKGLPTNRGQTTPAQLASMFEVGMGEDVFEDVPDATFDDFIDSLNVLETKGKSPTELGALGKRAMKSNTFKNASEQTAANIKKIASVLPSFTKEYIDQLPTEAIGQAFNAGDLKDLANIDEDKARRLGKAAMASIRDGALTAADVKEKLGAEVFIKGLDGEDFDKIPDDTMEDDGVLAMLQERYEEMPVENQLKVIEKMKRGNKTITDNVCSLGKICQGLTLAEIKSWDPSFLDTIKAAGGKCKLDCNRAQLGAMAEILVAKLGEPGASNAKYDTETVSSLFVIFPGMSKEQLGKFPTDDKLPELFSKLEGTGKLSEAKSQTLEAKITAYYTGDNKVSTADQVALLAKVLKGYNESALKKEIPTSLCADVVKKLKGMDKTTVTKSVLESQVKYALECLTGATSGAITTDVVQELGDYVCFLGARVSDLDATAVKDAAGSKLQTCPPMDAATRKKYKEKIQSAAGITDLASLDGEKMGMIMSFLTDEDAASLAKIPAAVRSEALDYISDILDKLDIVVEQRAALRDGVDTAALAEGNTQVVKALVDARISERTTASSAARRRKRATASLTCSDIKAMGQQAKALTTVQLKELSDAVFLECLTTLGKVMEWSAEQKTELASRLKTAAIHNSDLTAWTANNVQDSGTLLEGLSTADLGTLAWTTSLLGTHGTRPTWTPEQRASVASKWLTSEKSDSVASITGTELNTIGHFSCGLTDTQIGSITDAAYGDAVIKIGELSKCSEQQLKAFAGKAKNVFGAVSTWSTATTTNVNNVLAGLTGSELSQMSGSHLAEIRPQTIAILPAATISSLTVNQIRGLSKSQAQRITPEQQKLFNPDQLQAVMFAGGYNHVGDSGAETIRISAIASVLVIMTALFMM